VSSGQFSIETVGLTRSDPGHWTHGIGLHEETYPAILKYRMNGRVIRSHIFPNSL